MISLAEIQLRFSKNISLSAIHRLLSDVEKILNGEPLSKRDNFEIYKISLFLLSVNPSENSVIESLKPIIFRCISAPSFDRTEYLHLGKLMVVLIDLWLRSGSELFRETTITFPLARIDDVQIASSQISFSTLTSMKNLFRVYFDILIRQHCPDTENLFRRILALFEKSLTISYGSLLFGVSEYFAILEIFSSEDGKTQFSHRVCHEFAVIVILWIERITGSFLDCSSKSNEFLNFYEEELLKPEVKTAFMRGVELFMSLNKYFESNFYERIWRCILLITTARTGGDFSEQSFKLNSRGLLFWNQFLLRCLIQSPYLFPMITSTTNMLDFSNFSSSDHLICVFLLIDYLKTFPPNAVFPVKTRQTEISSYFHAMTENHELPHDRLLRKRQKVQIQQKPLLPIINSPGKHSFPFLDVEELIQTGSQL
jgi:hypothetical protein